MKVFITGIAGFLGSHVAAHFLKMGWEVSRIDSLIGGYQSNVPLAANFYHEGMDDIERLTELTEDIDVVYHTACTAYEGLSVFSPSLINYNTIQIATNMMTAAIRSGVPRFVHCSSMARYGTQTTQPFTEDMICKPQDPYGISKYATELMLQNLAEVHNIHLTIAVPHNIIGPRQKYDDPFRNVASIMMNLMMQGRQPVIYGDGTQLRCFSAIEDVIECLAMFAYADYPSSQVFNIGPDEHPCTINELASKIAKQLNFGLDPIYMRGRPQEVKYATCSSNKIRKTFGYQTKIELDACLRSMINYIAENGTKDFDYHLPIEINNANTPETWSKKLF